MTLCEMPYFREHQLDFLSHQVTQYIYCALHIELKSTIFQAFKNVSPVDLISQFQ
jgi:hypothetical protein